METPEQWIDAGAWVGRQQAFAVIASKCTAAQALALKQVKESRSYVSLGLNWEQFCHQHAGISRSYADDLIARLDEFGDAYFRLCEIARISPETYRGIAGTVTVTADSIEIDGEALPLTRSNTARIRSAVKRLREQLREARAEGKDRIPTIPDLSLMVDLLMLEATRAAASGLDPANWAALQSLARHAIGEWTEFQESLAANPR
jgi:hypothetical protein